MNKKWRDSRCIVTGASGFLGGKLLSRLLAEDVSVMGIDNNFSDRSRLFREGSNSTSRVFIQNRLENSLHEMRSFFAPVSAEKRFLFHFAGLADVGECQANPKKAYEANVHLTQEILEFCKDMSGATVVYPSTGLVYGDKLDHPAAETDPTLAATIYTGMKLAAENIISAYASSNYCRGLMVRLSNVYDRDVNAKTVIGRILSQARRRTDLHVDHQTPVRDFIHAADAVEAFCRLAAAFRLRGCLTVNVSSGKGHSIGEVVKTVSRISNVPIRDLSIAHNCGSLDSRLILSNKKLGTLTGWKPGISLLSGLSDCLSLSD